MLKKKKSKPSEEMSLNITSMADIFTILLVFLLKSYATSAVNVTPAAGMRLPSAVGDNKAFEALKVELHKGTVQLEGQLIEGQGDSMSKNLAEAFAKYRARQDEIAKVNTDVSKDSKLLIVADEHVPYSLVKVVLASAATSGYSDFKLAVVNANE